MTAETKGVLDLAEIAQLEERRQAEMLAAVTPLVRPFAGGVMGFHEPGSWQNQACGVGLEGLVADDELDAMVEFYVSRGVEPRVELSPFAHPSLIEGLGKRGFVVREFEHVLARELPAGEDIEARLPYGRPAGLELSFVDKSDTDAIERAVETMLQGFYPDGNLPKAMVDACRSTLLLDSTVTFVAKIDGVLAATGSLSCGSQVASLMGVSTATQFRQRGIQQALIATRLAAARERGCVLVTIGSRPGMSTERNAIRLGFRVAYTKVIVVRPGEGLATSV
jgi:GNAT superfamily N-acetyltransferase